MIDRISPKYKKILEKAKPYVLSHPDNFETFDLSPWGVTIEKEMRISCIDHRRADFFNLLHRLDALAFGPVGMPMDKWVFFDCGEMPGGICGFAIDGKDLSAEVKREFHVSEDYEGPIPVSMYISIPMASGKSWFGHNLSSANRVLADDALSGLGLFTKAFAIKVFKIQSMYGATQWDSKALHIHLQLADMEIHSAYTPAHSFVNTMTYRSEYTDEGLIEALSTEKRISTDHTFLHPIDDEQESLRLQERITAGERFVLPGRPVVMNGKMTIPVKKID